MTLDHTMTRGVYVLTPKRNLTGGDETQQLTTAVEEALAGGVTRVIVDLGKVSFVNSMGLAGLQRARLACIGHGASFMLAGVGERIKNLLVTTRLVILFDSFDTLEEAIAAQKMAKGAADATMPTIPGA